MPQTPQKRAEQLALSGQSVNLGELESVLDEIATTAPAGPAAGAVVGEDDEMEDGEEHECEGGEFGEEAGGVDGGKAFGDDDDRRVSEDGSTHSLTLRGGSLGSSSVQARRVSVAHNTLDMSSKNIQVKRDEKWVGGWV